MLIFGGVLCICIMLFSSSVSTKCNPFNVCLYCINTIINIVVRTYQIKENGMFDQLIGIFLVFIRLGDIRFYSLLGWCMPIR